MDNQKIVGILLKVQMDDLKDAEMLADYARKIKDAGDTNIAMAMMNRAKTRLAQMEDCKRSVSTVMQRMKDEAAMNGTTLDEGALYADLYREHVNDWEEAIRNKMDM